jgi:ankyrin repeat protein
MRYSRTIKILMCAIVIIIALLGYFWFWPMYRQELLYRAIDKRDISKVEQMINIGADVNYEDPAQVLIPLQYAIFHGNQAIVDLLIRKGANINTKSLHGLTALHISVSENNKAVAELLIAAGADININNYEGMTPLHFAILLNRKDIVSLLVNKGAALNVRDKDGRTPLRQAIRRSDKAMITLLKAHGAKE